MNIIEPGIYRDVDAAEYHADPCPSPSLNQSLCKVLLNYSPEHAWQHHPRLNPNFDRDDDTKFDLGNAVHLLMLGRGQDFEVLPFDDWRKKAAQDAREEAAEIGKIAILQHQFERALDMMEIAQKRLLKHEDSNVLTAGSPEVMLAWQEDGIWFRSLVDWLHDDLRTVDDYKTSGMSMAPHVIGLRAEAAGWHIQAAFIERGLDVLDPMGRGRRRFRFIGQETEKPHALTVMHMDEHWMTMGRKQVDMAVNIWRQCIYNDKWPGYPARSIVPVFPGYREAQWLERELSGEFDPNLMMAG